MQIIILYTLKSGVTREDFETFVRSVDYPTMRGLDRVSSFKTYRSEKLLMGAGTPSIAYIEVFDIPDMEGFLNDDLPSATVMGIMEQFLGFAETPEFIIADEVK